VSAVFFTTAGTCECLYTEKVDLSSIGRIHVRRTTLVLYDNADGRWVVTDTFDNELFSDPSRQKCLDWERRYLEQRETAKHGGVI
jgi:hypothetical protein